jgi:hypothetical protein
MVSKFYKNEYGMTLLEVMVAGSIGIAVFYYISQSIVAINKSQVKFERKETVNIIKKNMIKILEDSDSWISNPEDDVPKPENDYNFYFFRAPGAEIEKISFTTSEINILDEKRKFPIKNWKCPESFTDCRVFLWTYGNKLITEKNINKLSKSHFRVVVAFESNTEDITRSFLPEFKVIILDTNKDNAVSARSPIFQINGTGSKRAGSSGLVEINGVKIDINSRKRCFLDFLKNFKDKSVGYTLCKLAESLAPSKCFKDFRIKFKTERSVALIACVGAKNTMPQKCFEKGMKEFQASEVYVAILCSGATSLMPIRCINEIIRLKGSDNDILRFKVCSRARDLTPAGCYVDLIKNSTDNIDVVENLCPQHK